MGSTYSVQKKAASVVDPSTGQVFYALFEQTYESNVYPRTPRWSAIYLGTSDKCMRRLVERSADCEGGMLKGPHGALTATAYIAQWREALASPSSLQLSPVHVQFDRFVYGISSEDQIRLRDMLARRGRPLSEDATEFRLDPNEDGAIELLADLIDPQSRTGMSAWKCFSVHDCGPNIAGVPYAPQPMSRPHTAGISVMKVPLIAGESGRDRDHLLSLNGQVSLTGWAYSTMGWFIRQWVAPAETDHPGCAEKAIHEFRAKLKWSTDADVSMRIVLRRDAPGATSFHEERYDTISALLGCSEHLVIETTLGALVAIGAMPMVRQLHPSQMAFEAAQPPAAMEPVVASADLA